MKVNNEKAIEGNYELKINVDEQHVDMKSLKITCDIDDEYEGQEIIAARTLKAKVQVCVCLTCNQKLAGTNLYKKNYPDWAHKAVVYYCGKCSEMEMKQTITFMKHVNKPVMNAATKDKVKNDQKYKVVEKAYFIMKKDMEN